MNTSNPITILIIDDNQNALAALGAAVHTAMPEVALLVAQTCTAGIELAASEDPDVIVLDIGNSAMDCFEICRRIKTEDRLVDIPVVFLTSPNTGMASRIKSLELGGEGFLSKPLEPPELIAQVPAMAKVKAMNRLRRTGKDRAEALTFIAISKDKHIEKPLGESETPFRSLFQKHAAVKLLIDPDDGRIVDANEAAAIFYGWPQDQLRRMKISDINRPSAWPGSIKGISTCSSPTWSCRK